MSTGNELTDALERALQKRRECEAKSKSSHFEADIMIHYHGQDGTYIDNYHFVATNEPPIKPGWYWAVPDDQRRNIGFELFQVRTMLKGDLAVVDRDHFVSLRSFKYWIGPLPLPREGVS